MPRELSIAFQTDKTPQQYIDLAKLVNEYDFDAVSVYCDAPFQQSYGPLLLMAPHIERARMGAAAVSPSRVHPIDIASSTALLSQLAKGAVYIGISRGAWLAAHGITELSPPITAMREAVDVVRYFLNGETGGYAGKVFNLAEHVQAPYPPAEKPIPILIGTWGYKLCVVAGQVADEVKVGGSANPDIVPVIAGYIADGERAAGRAEGSVGVVMGAVTVVDEDRQAARAKARREVALYLPVVVKLDPTIDIDPEHLERIRHHTEQNDADGAAQLIDDDLLDRFAFSGSPADIIRQSEALFDAGASRIDFGTPHGIPSANGIRLLGEHVLPALRKG